PSATCAPRWRPGSRWCSCSTPGWATWAGPSTRRPCCPTAGASSRPCAPPGSRPSTSAPRPSGDCRDPPRAAPTAAPGSALASVEWRVPLDEAWRRIGPDKGIQGNLDPAVLVAPFEVVVRQADRVLRAAGTRDGHIFNLGHGGLPDTPSD